MKTAYPYIEHHIPHSGIIRVSPASRATSRMHVAGIIAAVFLIALDIIAPVTAAAQSLPSLFVPSDATTLSLAGVGVCAPGGAYSLENNVAAMSLAEKRLHAGAAFGKWQPSYSANSLVSAGATFKATDDLAVGLFVKKFGYQSYNIVTESGSVSRDGSFTPKEFNAAIGLSYRIVPCLSVGVTAKIVKSSLSADAEGTAFGADVGAYFSRNAIRAGLSVNNLGTKMRYGDDSHALPAMLKAGAGYDLDLGSSRLAFSAEADYLFAGAFMAGAAVQYDWSDWLFVRCGYHYGDRAEAIPSYASAGIGVKVFGVSLDAAWLFASEILRNSFALSLGYSF